MQTKLYQIDAFASESFKGNPAAVVPLKEWLPEATMQAIAEENNLAETAFYVPSKHGFDLRWFTPVAEVDLCGHATIAAAYVIWEKQGYTEAVIRFNSKSGPLEVSRDGDWLVLDFPAQAGTACTTPPALSKALGKEPLAVFKAMDYMAIFESQTDIENLEPDFGLLKELDLRGVIATAPGKQVDFVSRFFAPNFGINEDPVTGSAHCTLTPYWAGQLGRTELTAKQLSKRSGDLKCELCGDRVRIAGKAVAYLEGQIQV